MTLIDHARAELDRAGLLDPDSDYDGMIGRAVLALVETFAAQGHSAGSGLITRDLFTKVASYQPLTPLTGDDDEWTAVDFGPDMVAQNRRCSSVFKRADGTAYDIDVVVHRWPDGDVTLPSAREPITFPYQPGAKRIVDVDRHGDPLT